MFSAADTSQNFITLVLSDKLIGQEDALKARIIQLFGKINFARSGSTLKASNDNKTIIGELIVCFGVFYFTQPSSGDIKIAESEYVFPNSEKNLSQSLRRNNLFSNNSQDALGFYGVKATHVATGVKIAVIDSGLNENDREWKAKIPQSNREIFGFTTIHDNHGHGNFCLSMMAKTMPLKYGIASDAEFYVAKVSDGNTYNNMNLVTAIKWAIEKSVNIISISLGTPRGSTPTEIDLARAILAAKSKGILVFVAAGNSVHDIENGNPIQNMYSPSECDGAIAVGSLIAHDEISEITPILDNLNQIAFLGLGLNVSGPEGHTMSGTSVACPLVAGIAAVHLNRFVKLNNYKREQFLLELIGNCNEITPTDENKNRTGNGKLLLPN